MLYSDDGLFKITKKDTIYQNENDLLTIDDRLMNIKSDKLRVKDLYIEGDIYNANNGNLKFDIPMPVSMQERDFVNMFNSLNIEASNVKFTSSNFDIALKEDTNNKFNINKIRKQNDAVYDTDNFQSLNHYNENYSKFINIIDSKLYLYSPNGSLYNYNINAQQETEPELVLEVILSPVILSPIITEIFRGDYYYIITTTSDVIIKSDTIPNNEYTSVHTDDKLNLTTIIHNYPLLNQTRNIIETTTNTEINDDGVVTTLTTSHMTYNFDVTLSSNNKYNINDANDANGVDILYLGIGTYYINNIPQNKPFKFVKGLTSIIIELNGGSKDTNEQYDYYNGDIKITVAYQFNEITIMDDNDSSLLTIKYQEFKLINPLDLYKTGSVLYIADDNNILSVNLDDPSNNTTFLSKNEKGNIDGLLNHDAKIGSIVSMTFYGNYIYIADDDNHSIRKIDLDTEIITTIAGYVPTKLDNVFRSGENTGNGYDTRFIKLVKIKHIVVTDKEYLLVLHHNADLDSKIIIIELETNYSSILYKTDKTISDFEFNNNNIYIIELNQTEGVPGVHNTFRTINVIDFSKYHKENQITVNFNNIFNISSIPFDSMTDYYDYASTDYDFTTEQGYLKHFSLTTNNEETFVTIGASNIGRHARIGISADSEGDIDLNVGGIIKTDDIIINNQLTASIIQINELNTNSIKASTDESIIIHNHIIPNDNYTINLGQSGKSYNSLNIKDIYLSESISNGFQINNVGPTVYFKSIGQEDINANVRIKTCDADNIYLNDTENLTKTSIDYTNSNISISMINQSDEKIGDSTFEYSFSDNKLTVDNLAVLSNFELNTDFTINKLIVDEITTTTSINTTDLECEGALITTLNSDLINISNITVYTDIYVHNDTHIYSNLYVNGDAELNDLYLSNIICYNNANLTNINANSIYTSNLVVQGYTTTINTQTYQSENLEIINTQSDGPSLSILQNNNVNNIIDTSNLLTDKKFIVDKDGLVGINIIPTTELDVNGDIKFTGNINNVSATTLSYIQYLTSDVQQQINVNDLNTSNYIGKVELVAENSSNLFQAVDDKIETFMESDYLNNNLHPIVTKYDESDNIIYKYTGVDNDIFIKSTDFTSSSNYYIVLKGDLDDLKRHYKISVVNDILTDILIVAGGASGSNLDIDNLELSTGENDENISGISKLTISEKFLYTYDGNKIIKKDLNSLSTDGEEVLEQTNITNIKISKNDKILVYSVVYSDSQKLYIKDFEKDTQETAILNINKIIIDNANNFVYTLNTDVIHKTNIQTNETNTIGTTGTITTTDITDIEISKDDNILYISHSNKISKYNLKTATLSDYITETVTGNITKILLSHTEEFIYYIDGDGENKKYNTKTGVYADIQINLNKELSITYDDYKIFYIDTSNLKSIFVKTTKYPAPGGAGGVLYRNDAIINRGIYDLYVAGKSTNSQENGNDTIGFGVTAMGGGKVTTNYNNLLKPGDYNGYIIDNDYIIKNNNIENKQYYSEVNYGGTSATNILNNDNYYDGKDGYYASFIKSETKLIDDSGLGLELYYGGGSGSKYYGIKGQGGGTDSVAEAHIKQDFIAKDFSGAGASGGYNRLASIYPKTKIFVEKDPPDPEPLYQYLGVEEDVEISFNASSDGITSNKIITIFFELPTNVEISIENPYSSIGSPTEKLIFTKQLYGEYRIEYDKITYPLTIYHMTFSKITYLENEIEQETVIYKYNSDTFVDGEGNTNNYYISPDITFTTDNSQVSEDIVITFNNIKYTEESPIVDTNKIQYNDKSEGASGLIILKYNLYKEPVISLQEKFDNRLKILEESLLNNPNFNYRIRDETVTFKYFKIYKENNNDIIYYDNIYLDQSYEGIKIDIDNNLSAINNYTYKLKLYLYKLNKYNNIIPNITSQEYVINSDDNIIKFNTQDIEDIFIYIDKIEITIIDNVYSFNNNGYKFEKNVNNNSPTPYTESSAYLPLELQSQYIINSQIEPYNLKIISESKMLTVQIDKYSNFIIKWSSYDGSKTDNLPYNVFNNTGTFGLWAPASYLAGGTLSTANGGITGKNFIFINTSSGSEFYKLDDTNSGSGVVGEWIYIQLDRQIQLDNIIIKHNGVNNYIQKCVVFAKNKLNDDGTLNDDERYIKIDPEIYIYNTDDNTTKLANSDTPLISNSYDTFYILFEELSSQSTSQQQLKIDNIKLYGIFKNWESDKI